MKRKSIRPSTAAIPVGDRWRASLRLPVFGTLGLAATFLLCTVPVKETASLFDHAPWRNDPFDVVTSFMILLVPLVVLLCVPRVLLCRRLEPLSAARARDVLRGCRVVLAGIGLALLSEWVAVAVRGNRPAWNASTRLQVGLLVGMTCCTAALAAALRRAGLPRVPDQESSESPPDWLGDALAFIGARAGLFGPARRVVLRLVALLGERVAAGIRRHPLLTVLTACLVLGAGVGANQGIREGYPVRLTAIVSLLFTIGMFGLVAAAGDYLGLVRSSSPSIGARRRSIDAAVVTCVGVLVTLALRRNLWWIVDSTDSAANLTQLVELLSISAGVIFSTALGTETALRMHARTARRLPRPASPLD